MVLSNYSFFQYCGSNIGLSSICLSKVIAPNFLYNFFVSFLYNPFYSYRSSNYRKSDCCRSFSLLKAIAMSFPLPFSIAFKFQKNENYHFRNRWKSDNYTESNAGKKPCTKPIQKIKQRESDRKLFLSQR